MSQQTFGFAAVPNYRSGIPAPPVNPLPARNTDPQSSKEAAHEMVDSGRMAGQRLAVYVALKRHNNCTTQELSQASGIPVHIIGRRMTELDRMGLVSRGPQRLCKVGNRNATEWRAK